MTPRRKRRDNNHTQIVSELRSLGFSVQDVADVDNFIDIIVGGYRENFMFEIKPEGEELRQSQKDLAFLWQGQIYTIRSTEDALRIMEEAG